MSNYKVGININGDVDCLKYVFSTDLNTFIIRSKENCIKCRNIR